MFLEAVKLMHSYSSHKSQARRDLEPHSCSDDSQTPPPLLLVLHHGLHWLMPSDNIGRYHVGCRSSKVCLLYKQVSLAASKCLFAQELPLLRAGAESTSTPAASTAPTKCTTEVCVTRFKFLPSLLYRSKNLFRTCCSFTGPSVFKMVVQGTSSHS